MSKKKKKSESSAQSRDDSKPKAAKPSPEQVEAKRKRIAWIALGAMMGLYAAAFIAVCAIKYLYFLYNDFDLAIFSQAAWVTARGSLYSSILGLNYLGSHMNLLLWPIAPIYALIPHPMTLLVIQTLVLALGAIPVYLLSRRTLKSNFAALCFGALYLLFPALGYSNLYEFHPVTLATTPLLFAFYYLREGRLLWMTVFALVALLAKENVPLVVGMTGLYAFIVPNRRRWLYALCLIVPAAAFLVVSFGIVMPAINEGQVEYTSFYAHWMPEPPGGEAGPAPTMGAAFRNMLAHPLRAFTELFVTPGWGGDPARYVTPERTNTAKKYYYLHMLLPVMGLALLSPLTLVIALPVVAQHMLSYRFSEHTIVYHYTSLVTPFVIAAAVLGVRNLLAFVQRTRGRSFDENAMRADRALRALALSITIMAVPVALLSNLFFGPVIGMGVLTSERSSEPIAPDGYNRALAPYMRAMASRIPAGAPVATDFRFMSRAANRYDLHSLHHIFKGKYTYSTKDYPLPGDLAAVAVDTNDWRYTSFWRYESGRRMRELMAKNDLVPVDAAGPAVLLLRGADGERIELFSTGHFEIKQPQRVDFGYVGPDNRFSGQLACLGGELQKTLVRPGELLPFTTCWQRLFPAMSEEEMRRWVPNYLVYLSINKDAPGNPPEVHRVLRHFCYTFFPIFDWPTGQMVREQYRMVIPADIPPGSYMLLMRVAFVQGASILPAASPMDDGTIGSRPILLGRFSVTE